MFFSGLGSCKFAAAADDMCHCLCMLVAQPESGILRSVVDLLCHCSGVEGLFFSCHDQSLVVVVAEVVVEKKVVE